MEKKRSLTFFLILLFIVGTLPITNPVSADGEVDNWPENDAWLRIELISWSANDSVEWDNGGGLPDPIFKICVEADGDNLDCINTPTWENQLTLNNSWNYSMDIPDNSNILNITIECEDNDALNDDECDMNSELNYWRLYAEYNWSATPSLTISGDGDDDDDVTWKNAASIWRFSIDGYGDEDGDGYSDKVDICPLTNPSEVSIINGCSYEQVDHDSDGVPTGIDHSPFISEIGLIEQVGFSGNYVTLGSLNQIPYHAASSIELLQRIYLTDFLENGVTDTVDSMNYVSNPNGKECVYFLFEKNTYICLHGSSRPAFIGVSSSTPILTDSGISPGVRLGDLNISLPGAYSLYFGDASQQAHRFEGEIGLGDLDMDGNIDLLLTIQNCMVMYGDGSGSFANPIEIPGIDVCGLNSQVIDLDNDGDADLVNPYGYYIQGEDTFVKHSFSLTNVEWDRIVFKITDYEKDGDIDILFDLYRSGSSTSGDPGQSLGYAYINQVNDDNDDDDVLDMIDQCPNTPSNESVDEFGCSYSQKDDDNDGVSNLLDSCPNTPLNSTVNNQGCTIEDTQDSDSDNDNWSDFDESQCSTDPLDDTDFPTDLDGDGTCDALEGDTDSDGIADVEDVFPSDPNEWLDTDGDGFGDNADTDDDNDGWSDADEYRCGSDPLDSRSVPANIEDDGKCFVGQEDESKRGSSSGS